MGSGPKLEKKQKAPKPLLDVWKTRSVFWDLKYWPVLDMPHCLDLTHITKNVFKSLFAALLNMPEKTKDVPKARNDQIHLGIREELHGGIESSDDEETNRHKGKKVKKMNTTAPILLYSK